MWYLLYYIVFLFVFFFQVFLIHGWLNLRMQNLQIQRVDMDKYCHFINNYIIAAIENVIVFPHVAFIV